MRVPTPNEGATFTCHVKKGTMLTHHVEEGTMLMDTTHVLPVRKFSLPFFVLRLLLHTAVQLHWCMHPRPGAALLQAWHKQQDESAGLYGA